MLFLSFHEQISRSVPPASSVSEWRRQAIERGYLGRGFGPYLPTRARGTMLICLSPRSDACDEPEREIGGQNRQRTFGKSRTHHTQYCMSVSRE